jgi:hypothetical protein
MESSSVSNTKLLKQHTKRERKPRSSSKKMDALKKRTGQKGSASAGKSGGSYLKGFKSPIKSVDMKLLFNVTVFVGATYAIYKYGDKISETMMSFFPTEESMMQQI